ncbi:MAG TPA: EAL domain-containing response regulator [Halothiobacillus sp.]|nr:EAL domain-containing response regulator [Halothiobacillus sp.]
MIDELNLLVVEDDDFQRKLIVSMLRSLGATSVAAAGNGKKALELIHGENAFPVVDIVFCDLNMPEMDGMEFLRHLSQEHTNIAVIIISAVDSKLLDLVQRMAAMYEIKLLGAIEKPISLEKLMSLISTYSKFEHERVAPAVQKDLSLEEILQGIEDDQFEPYFQPKIDMKSGELVGAEALARWIHPDRGVIGPYAFIPLLEQSGNIDDLTFLMLEKSAKARQLFEQAGYPLSLSINLSRVSLNDPALADKITQTLRQAGVDPKHIILEITESAAMTEKAHALENLARLCMNGFALSIDDYGTGYSSLQQLTRIAFSELKIDQSFVKNLSQNEALRIVVQSSIDMARRLGVKSVAEGVETREDWDTIARMGCDTVQGYFIAKPMSLQDFQDFMPRAGLGHPILPPEHSS